MPFVQEFPRAVGSPPAEDGSINSYFYDCDEGPSCNWSPLVYVNGMMSDRMDHMKAALLLSHITKRTVVGVYNQRGTSLWEVEEMNRLLALNMQQDKGVNWDFDGALKAGNWFAGIDKVLMALQRTSPCRFVQWFTTQGAVRGWAAGHSALATV
jgi:hypothetical protein